MRGTINWNKKDVWTHREKDFTVEVSRHDGAKLDGTIENIWCVYAYVYKGHPAFEMFKADGSPSDQPCFTVHSYPSYYKPHRDKEGVIASHQLGWDYNHDGDWHYLECATKDQAGSVFWDSSKLVEQLKDWGGDD